MLPRPGSIPVRRYPATLRTAGPATRRPSRRVAHAPRVLPAELDCGYETRRDVAIANVADQDIDCGLPSRLMYLLRDPIIRDYPRVVLCHRYEDENATAIARMGHPADDELLNGRSVRLGAFYRTRNQREAQRYPRKSKPAATKTISCNRKIRCTLHCVKSINGHGTKSASTLAQRIGTYA